MEFPQEILVKEIQSINPELDPKKTEKYLALYHGGSYMTDAVKKSLLIQRQNEMTGDGRCVYEARLKRSYYLNRAGGLVDFVVSSITADSPKITVGENATEEQRKYWLGLNFDADGFGTPYATLFRQNLRDQLVTNHPYVEVNAEGVDAKMSRVDPAMIIDWGVDDNGDRWVKKYGVRELRSNPFNNTVTTQHIWTIYTATDTVVYRAISQRENDSSNKFLK